MVRRSLVVVAAAVAILASAAPARAIATIANLNFSNVGEGGTLIVFGDISDPFANLSATGTDVPIGTFNATFLDAATLGVISSQDYVVVGGLLNFNTLASTITIIGSIPGLGVVGDILNPLLTGSFTSSSVVADFPPSNALVQGAGPDTKNPDLLTALGLAPDTPFEFFGFTLAGIDTDSTGQAGEYYVPNFTLMSNMEQPTNAVPEPGTLLLLGSGLAAAGIWSRRGFRKQA